MARIPGNRAHLASQLLPLTAAAGSRGERMRLLEVNISEFRSITDRKLKADGLVVLFGPNSAGKTSVLEAAE